MIDPVVLANGWTLKNRFVMSAMTRGFADADHCCNDTIRKYYERRAANGVGLILTEGIIIDQRGDGYNGVPWMTDQNQAESWKPTINAVQTHGSKIISQLWHCGRISHSDYTGGKPPLSSTDKAAEGINRQNQKPFSQPERLTEQGIQEVIEQYIRAARLALSVGFDGVQLHLGHGYLADQFLDARINDRSDKYGGSVSNRCRFALELVEAVLAAVPKDSVIVRISPSRDMGGVYDWPDLTEMLNYFIPELDRLGVRILDISCARANYFETSGRIIRMVRPNWKHSIMGGASLTLVEAEKEVADKFLDAVTWGRFFIANPDLVRIFLSGKRMVDFRPDQLKELN